MFTGSPNIFSSLFLEQLEDDEAPVIPLVAEVREKTTGRRLVLRTTEPALQVHTSVFVFFVCC